jgi:hypothetical protein
MRPEVKRLTDSIWLDLPDYTESWPQIYSTDVVDDITAFVCKDYEVFGSVLSEGTTQALSWTKGEEARK